jgi:hypothetical protein
MTSSRPWLRSTYGMPFKCLCFNLTLHKNCDSDGLLFDKKKMRESTRSKSSGHSTSLRRIYRSAGGRPNLGELTNPNKTSRLNEIAILSYCHIAILTIGNQDMATCQKRKGWISGGIHRISGQIIFIFMISIFNNLMLLLETFRFVVQCKNNPATCEMSAIFWSLF